MRSAHSPSARLLADAAAVAVEPSKPLPQYYSSVSDAEADVMRHTSARQLYWFRSQTPLA